MIFQWFNLRLYVFLTEGITTPTTYKSGKATHGTLKLQQIRTNHQTLKTKSIHRKTNTKYISNIAEMLLLFKRHLTTFRTDIRLLIVRINKSSKMDLFLCYLLFLLGLKCGQIALHRLHIFTQFYFSSKEV